MIKAITLLKRKYGMDVPAFQDHWRNHHAGLIRRLPGVHRYVQNHMLADNYVHAEPRYDGIAELWAKDIHAFRAIAAGNAYAAVRDDETRFIIPDPELILTSETVLKDDTVSGRGFKLIGLLRRKADLSVAEFQRYWRDVHGPAVARLPGLVRYVLSPARPGGYSAGRSPAYDGLSALWFNSMDEARLALDSKVYSDIINDSENFITAGATLFLACDEHVIIE